MVMLKHVCRGLYKIIENPKRVIIEAFIRDINLLSWLLEKTFLSQWKNICAYAAFYGDLEVLMWFRDKYPERYYSFGTCYLALIAARFGHLRIIKWLRRTGQRWAARYVASTSAFANHLNILRWLKKKKFFDYTKKITLYAGTKNLNPELMLHIGSHFLRARDFTGIIERAVIGSNLELLFWLIERHFVTAGEVYKYAYEYRMMSLVGALQYHYELYF